MAIKIIKADPGHAARIASIGKKSFRNAFEDLFQHREELFDYLETTYDPVKLTRSLRKENNIYLLAFLDSQAAGFAKIKEHSLHEAIESSFQTELQKIYVLPEYQGKGVGSALMKETCMIAKELNPDFLWLDTYASNRKAIRFYEKNGFRKMDTSHFTIGSQTFDYFIMTRPIAIQEVIPVNAGVR